MTMCANLTTKHLIGWGFLFLGIGVSIIGWLWLQIAARLNFTLSVTGWRGIVAIGLIIGGLVILWQALPYILGFD